jgi:pimeloyl-ACP methyl ester carboxylesterase
LSYGTYIGALYAQEYPDRVRAMVFDGAVDPAVPLEEVSIDQAQGFEHALDAFLEDCADDDDCAFHHNGEPRRALDDLRASIDRKPLRTDDGRLLGPTQFDLGLAAPLYAGDEGYDLLAEALQSAEEGDADDMLEIFDGYVGRTADGRYSPEWPAFIAISCADGPVLDPGSLTALAERAAVASPTFGATTIGLTFPCSFWPVPPVNTEPTAVVAPDAPPLLVVGTTGDPATPIEWAEGLVRELVSGRLVTVEGTSHTSSLSANPCLDDVLVPYLVRLRPPPPGRECPA